MLPGNPVVRKNVLVVATMILRNLRGNSLRTRLIPKVRGFRSCKPPDDVGNTPRCTNTRPSITARDQAEEAFLPTRESHFNLREFS